MTIFTLVRSIILYKIKYLFLFQNQQRELRNTYKYLYILHFWL